jgi:hypothetical protein
MIEGMLKAWTLGYNGKAFPTDMETLVSHLKNLVVRLGGGEAPVMACEAAPTAEREQVSALHGKLEEACTHIIGGIEHLKGDRPRLETRLADLATVRTKQKELADAHERLAAEAKKREVSVAKAEGSWSTTFYAPCSMAPPCMRSGSHAFERWAWVPPQGQRWIAGSQLVKAAPMHLRTLCLGLV